MKKPLLMSLTATVFVATLGAADLAQAQNRIYRCGNEYTNTVQPGQKGCKLLEGGNVTVVQRPRASDVTRVASASQASEVLRGREAEAQRQRDADARQILQAELARAESRQAELMAEYNNGEPEKMGPEFRNHQKYLDRVAEIKANIERNEGDIAGLRREIERVSESK